MRLLASILMLLVTYWCLTESYEKRLLMPYRELTGLVIGGQKHWHRKIDSQLMRYGAKFHYGRGITPTSYLFVKLVLFLSVAIILGARMGMLWMVFATMIFYLPDGMLLYLNKKDNEKMLSDIKLVYRTMEMQIRAGVYVLDALSECYSGVSHKRLKAALLDLTGDIAVHADIYEALGNFRSKFENGHIDSLCVTILQALESGQAVELLKDLGEQVKDVEQLLLERKKSALDRSLTFYQLGILTIVLGIAIYVCIVQMLGVALNL